MSEEKQRTANELFDLAAKGDPQALWELAVLGYWEYAEVPSKPSKQELMQYAEAAGTNGDGYLEKKVGDFFHFEFQDDCAKLHYAAAHRKILALAMEGDGQAQFELAMQFAYGQGCEQDDRNACFWCLMAAQNGHKEAQYMMSNFWTNRTVFPVCAEMAEHWEKTAKASAALPQETEEVATVRKTAAQAQCTENEIAAVRYQMKRKAPARYRVEDLGKRPGQRVVNFIGNRLSLLVGGGFILYAVTTILAFLINFFIGFQETGFGNVISNIFAFCLRVPLQIYDENLATVKQMCNYMAMDPDGWLLSPIILCANAIIPAIWLAVLAIGSGIIVFVLQAFVREKLSIQPIPYAGEAEASARRQLAKAEEKHAAQTRELEDIYRQYQVPEVLQSPMDMMGICNLAAFMQWDFSRALEKYAELIRADLPDMEQTILHASENSFSAMGLYFLLPRIGMTDEEGNRVTLKYRKAPARNFDVSKPFVRGYLAYRCGSDFAEARKAFEEAFQSEQSSNAEKTYAAWYLAAMNRSELVPLYDREQKNVCDKQAERYEKYAQKNQCPYAVMTAESIGNLAWQRDGHMLDVLSKLYKQSDETLSDYLHDMALRTLQLQYDCGNPFNMEEWNGWKTECIWPRYYSLKAKVDKAEAACGTVDENDETPFYRRQLEQYSPLVKQGKRLAGRGLACGDDLNKLINDVVNLAEYVVGREAEQRREQYRQEEAAREREINRQMDEWNKKADAFERTLNAYGFSSYKTDMERALTGEMSREDYDRSASLRYDMEKSHREKLESEYDQ